MHFTDHLVILKSPFIDYLDNILKNHPKNFTYSVFIGDMNIDLNENTDDSQIYLDTLGEYGYNSAINTTTRPQSGTCIDHIFIKSKKTNLESIIPLTVETCITDYYTILMQIIFNDKYAKETTANSKFYKQINEGKLIQIIKSTDWKYFFEINDLENSVTEFVRLVQTAIDGSSKLIKVKNKDIKRKPWVTRSLLESINRKNTMYARLKKNPQNEILKTEYNIYRKVLEKAIKDTKMKYYKNKIEQGGADSKRLWQLVNELTKARQHTDISLMQTEDGNITCDPIIISEKFNSFFSNVGANLAKNIKQDRNYTETEIKSDHTFFFFPTDVYEIQEIILQLKNKKSPGPDGLKSETLKNHINLHSQTSKLYYQ